MSKNWGKHRATPSEMLPIGTTMSPSESDRSLTKRTFPVSSVARSTITALAAGFAQQEGRIKSLDDRADQYATKLRGTIYGDTTIRNLLRMASGAKYEQTYDGTGDTGRFSAAIARDGIEGAARIVTARETAQGTRFYYASAQTTMLAAVVRGATGMSLSEYLTPRLWQAIGAEESALWYADRTGLEVALGNFNATLRDYARLGVVLANDGVRPDVDPGLKLVIVQTAANATAEAGKNSLGPDRQAFWNGVVSFYGKW
jgi:CubicO group peptidase (beta-lactamase class C family)